MATYSKSTISLLGPLFVSLLFAQVACSDGEGIGDGVTGTEVASGVVAGNVLPDSADVIVVWQVFTGSPDYTYLFGSGTYSGSSFSVFFEGDPPTEVVNNPGIGVGVGIVALIDPATSLSTGIFPDESLDSIYCVSSQYALIWIEPGAPGLGWTDAFPVGLSCGVCVPAGPSGGFDSFEPISCDELSIVVPFEGVCEWT